MPTPSAMVTRWSSVAKARYLSQLKRVHEEIDRLSFETSDLPEVFRRLRSESETAQVLIFASYLEDRITEIIRRKMRHLQTKEDENSLFGPSGPLATLSGRTLLCYQLGWLTGDTKRKLDAFRAIRNEFAHRAFKARFSDPAMRKLFARIDYRPEHMLSVIREALPEDDKAMLLEPQELTEKTRNLCNLAFLAEHTFRDLIELPFVLTYHIDRKSIPGLYDDSPSLVRRLYSDLASALMMVVFRSEPPDPLP